MVGQAFTVALLFGGIDTVEFQARNGTRNQTLHSPLTISGDNDAARRLGLWGCRAFRSCQNWNTHRDPLLQSRTFAHVRRFY
jgi:hypothetical protein